MLSYNRETLFHEIDRVSNDIGAPNLVASRVSSMSHKHLTHRLTSLSKPLQISYTLSFFELRVKGILSVCLFVNSTTSLKISWVSPRDKLEFLFTNTV